MRVNSTYNGSFPNRVVVGSGIAIVMLAIFFITSSFKEHTDHYLKAKQVNLIIRQIGHQLLLQAGDSTSRILPVTETKEGTFLLKFENEFVFKHDSLMVLSRGLLSKTQFPSGYTVTVQDCIKGDIVYGFQVNNTSPDILACSGRSQPPGCYTIEFAFPDFYESVEQKKGDIGQRKESVNVDPGEGKPKLTELKATTLDDDIDPRTKALTPVKADLQKDNPKPEVFKTTTFGYPLVKVVCGGMLVLLVVSLLIWNFGKNLKPLSGQNQHPAIINEAVSEFSALGKFLFNVKDQRLLLGKEVISLTDKECRVLELLHGNFGELIPRDTLMQEVWINEGVITGRSLDMFVSKLRKKLSRDPELKISNVHGKGYRLEISETQII